MSFSIVIVNFNTKNLLLKCINSIISSLTIAQLNYEIIVVDNGSKDGSATAIQNEKKKIRIIENKENVGFGRANNQAAKQAKGEYILFLNTDIEVHENALKNLWKFAKEQQVPAIIGSKLYNTDGTVQASCGPFYNLWVTFLMLFAQADRLGITRYSPNRVAEVDWVSGACLLIRKTDFIGLGGFDERIFMYMEEVELMYRAKQKGLHVLFYPGAHFTHFGAATSSKNADARPIINIYRGLLYMYQKHYSTFALIMLKRMLKVKAISAIAVGKLTNNRYLTKTYEQAYKLACHV